MSGLASFDITKTISLIYAQYSQHPLLQKNGHKGKEGHFQPTSNGDQSLSNIFHSNDRGLYLLSFAFTNRTLKVLTCYYFLEG